MNITKNDVMAAINGSSEDFISQVIDSVEFSCGKLSEDAQNKLYVDLQAWLSSSVQSFKFLPVELTFLGTNGREVTLQSDKLVLEDHYCTTTGTEYFIRKAAWDGGASGAERIASISKDEFKALRARFPEAKIYRSSMD